MQFLFLLAHKYHCSYQKSRIQKEINDEVTVAEVQKPFKEVPQVFTLQTLTVTSKKALCHIHLSGSMHLLLHLQQQCFPNISPSN